MEGRPVSTSIHSKGTLKGPPKGESYWDLVLRQFRRNWLAVVSFFFVLALFSIAIGAPFLANDKPLLLQGAYREAYQGRFQEWRLGGHPEMVEALTAFRAGGEGSEVEVRLQTIRLQLEYLASQLPLTEAQRLLEYLKEYERAGQATLAGDRALLSDELQKLEQNFQEISRQFDPEAVTFEQKLYLPVFSSLAAIDVFFSDAGRDASPAAADQTCLSARLTRRLENCGVAGFSPRLGSGRFLVSPPLGSGYDRL